MDISDETLPPNVPDSIMIGFSEFKEGEAKPSGREDSQPKSNDVRRPPPMMIEKRNNKLTREAEAT